MITLDVFDVAIEAMEAQIKRFQMTIEALKKMRHEQPGKVAARPNEPADEPTPVRKNVTKGKTAGAAKAPKAQAIGGRRRSESSAPKDFVVIKDVAQVLDDHGETATPFTIKKLLADTINVNVDEDAVRDVLDMGKGDFFTESGGKWGLRKWRDQEGLS